MCLAWFWHKFLYRIFLCFLETISHINRATRTMKKRHVLLLIFAFIAISIYAQNASAKINSVWVTHNVSKMQNVWNGWTWVTIPVNGMEIHTNFDINECRAQKFGFVCLYTNQMEDQQKAIIPNIEVLMDNLPFKKKLFLIMQIQTMAILNCLCHILNSMHLDKKVINSA